MPVPYWFDYCSIVVSFENKKCESSNFVLQEKRYFWPFLCNNNMTFRVSLSISAKKAIGIMIWIALTLP